MERAVVEVRVVEAEAGYGDKFLGLIEFRGFHGCSKLRPAFQAVFPSEDELAVGQLCLDLAQCFFRSQGELRMMSPDSRESFCVAVLPGFLQGFGLLFEVFEGRIGWKR